LSKANLYKKITILIVLYQENEKIIFENLKKLKNFKIIIVDNDGNLNLKKKIISNFKIYKYILNKINIGYSKGYNLCINLCDTEYSLILNADCSIEEDSIDNLLSAIENYKNCFIASPTSYNNVGELNNVSGDLPEKKTFNKIINLEGDICVERVLGAAMLINTKEMINLGLFDENLFLFFSDYDLCRRAKNQGKSVIQVYKSKCFHMHGISKIKNFFKKIYIKEYYFTLDELKYFHKINLHHDLLKNLKNKAFMYFIKFIINLFILNLKKSTTYFARISAYIYFKKNIKN
tara:strand:+ start:310 stop:1182 length:873 start_codon:yes stop_codon:yes gene_type:complete